MSTSETRNFKMHPKLLMDVIQRQAGTLDKAILELVMNAVDAKATQITIKLDQYAVTVEDDGEGFAGKEAITKVFEIFGQPHEESEHKTYGCFRMGRGQAFSFGLNTWWTGKFLMLVDVQNKGLDYELRAADEQRDGCWVHIALYDVLSVLDLSYVERALTKAVAFVPIPVMLNGERINKLATQEKWTVETDDAYIKVNDSAVMRIYNLGVLVQEAGSSKYGGGGIIVSKQQLKLNFARNDVISSCPVWKRIRAVLDKHLGTKLKNKKGLSAAERATTFDKFLAGEVSVRTIERLPLLLDVAGKAWSLHSFVSRLFFCAYKVSAAPRGNPIGDTIHQQRIAFIFSQDWLDEHHQTAQGLLEFLMEVEALHRTIALVDFEELAQNFRDDAMLIPDTNWTPKEKRLLQALSGAQNALTHFHYQDRRRRRAPGGDDDDERLTGRRLVLGRSPTALAWTDGESFIAFDQKFLNGETDSVEGWTRLVLTLLHELCHDGPDSDTHVHSQEFYEKFHEYSYFAGRAVQKAMLKYEAALKRAGKRLGQQHLAHKSRADSIQRQEALVG